MKIKELAKKVGMTKAYHLQVAMEISPSHAARLWNNQIGNPDQETLEKLCRKLGCTPNDIYEIDPPVQPVAKFQPRKPGRPSSKKVEPPAKTKKVKNDRAK